MTETGTECVACRTDHSRGGPTDAKEGGSLATVVVLRMPIGCQDNTQRSR